MTQPTAVIFDVGNVLFDWNLRFLYERLIDDDRALDAFLRDVMTMEWHLQHDAGRPFAETSAELIAQHPEHAALIAALGPGFNETIRGVVPGMEVLVAELHNAGVPLFAITNFSGEFWRPFRAAHAAFFDRFRDVVVSGDEGLMKPDRAIYELALGRFGLRAEEAVFFDDNPANVAGAAAVGIEARLFTGEVGCRAALVDLGFSLGISGRECRKRECPPKVVS
ncbi:MULTISPECIES: HAD family hydrolase [unclassified Sphingomonas]|uniref:HAD family hydrolase n=1 Tax=unclassified Sphingomonas TaxID=196159 RepID=UPI000BD060ED|nr:MAG: hydrolase [Sphingomonas sp. 12-62-6]OYX38251.1 MAG: hydrolase [Sphingomonas sp. 32-62-10]